MKVVRTMVVAGTGAGAAYFLDPDRGHSRRAQAKDRLAAAARQCRAKARRQERYEMGQAEGDMARAQGLGQFRPEDDIDVAQEAKSVLAGLDVDTKDVVVDVVDGVASLRGQVSILSDQAPVADAVSRIPGVREVEIWLHLPGEPAPNKASSLRAS